MSHVHPRVGESHLADWIKLIRAEYLEMPGLKLTIAQARRLWGLDHATSQVLLHALVDAKFLTQTRAGMFVRADA